MKRLIIFILMVLIFLASMGIGYFYLNTRDDQKKESKAEEDIFVENKLENEYIQIESAEEKISPNAELTEIIFYSQCGHEIVNTSKIPEKIINLTEEELREEYKEYTIETFSELQISLYKEKDATCPEHYKIGEADGIVNIYKKNENGEDELYEVTNIYLEYLPIEEQDKLKEGIEVIGKENLNATLENLES